MGVIHRKAQHINAVVLETDNLNLLVDYTVHSYSHISCIRNNEEIIRIKHISFYTMITYIMSKV